MPDLLLIPDNHDNAKVIEALASQMGLRVKTCFEIEKAEEWMRLRAFDALLLNAEVPFDHQQRLGSKLWEKNPVAALIMFDLSGEYGNLARRMRLFGAELAQGDRALEQIRSVLEGISDKSTVSVSLPVLVVEDLDAPRDIICAYVERLGYPNVIGISSAQGALDYLDRDGVKDTCIITDVRMPHMSGEELITTIRAGGKFSNVPIIALTAHGTPDCLIACLKAGASGFLVKPPKREALRREIERAVRILHGRVSPRLAQPDEVDLLKDALFGDAV